MTHTPVLCCAAEEGSRESVDAGCRRLTAAWVREAKLKDPQVETCDFFEAHEKAGHEALLPPGKEGPLGGGEGFSRTLTHGSCTRVHCEGGVCSGWLVQASCSACVCIQLPVHSVPAPWEVRDRVMSVMEGGCKCTTCREPAVNQQLSCGLS